MPKASHQVQSVCHSQPSSLLQSIFFSIIVVRLTQIRVRSGENVKPSGPTKDGGCFFLFACQKKKKQSPETA